MPVTLKQVAERSGLSFQTVSKILGRKAAAYSQETRDHVFRVAEELGYRPNTSARSMRTGSFGCVALIRSTVVGRSTLFRDLLIGIEDALAERDLHLTLARLPDQTLTEDNSVPKILREWMADGLLLNYHQDIPPRLQALVEKHALPSIWINSKHPTDCVYPADFETGRSAAEHLLQMGHTRIAFATLRTTHYSAADREAGYAEAMHQAGAVPLFLLQEAGCAASLPFWGEILSLPDRPTAIIAYMPHIAEAVYLAALRLGLRVPGDLSLSAFHESSLGDSRAPITTWLIPEYDMGYTAVERLAQKIIAPTAPLSPVVLPFRLDPGATCAPPAE